MSYSTVLFDLDGTLTDPFEGITKSIQFALEKMGVAPPDADELHWCIGPPLWDSFEVLLQTSDREVLDQGVMHYRDRYTVTGLFENTLISGIPELLQNLSATGVRSYVCTSKPHTYAGKIVEHFGLMPFFCKVYGSELDGTRSDKADLISYIITEENLGTSDTIMIGDRKHDLIGANANNVASVGVLWGYGSREELQNERPVLIAERPTDISELLMQSRKAD